MLYGALAVRYIFAAMQKKAFMAQAPAGSAPRPSGGAPLYAAIMRALRDEIVEGRWAPGDTLPTIDQLMTRYAAGRATVRLALKGLAEEGLIVSQRGRGTFVLERPRDRAVKHDLVAPAPGLRVTVLEREAAAELPTSRLLAESAPEALRSSFERVRKLHRHEGEPVCIVNVYFRPELLAASDDEALGAATVFQLMYPALSARQVRLRQTLAVGAAGLEAARLMECELGAPVVRMQRLLYAADGAEIYYLGDYEYSGAKYVMDIEGDFEDIRAIASAGALSVDIRTPKG